MWMGRASSPCVCVCFLLSPRLWMSLWGVVKAVRGQHTTCLTFLTCRVHNAEEKGEEMCGLEMNSHCVTEKRELYTFILLLLCNVDSCLTYFKDNQQGKVTQIWFCQKLYYIRTYSKPASLNIILLGIIHLKFNRWRFIWCLIFNYKYIYSKLVLPFLCNKKKYTFPSKFIKCMRNLK